MDGSAVSLSGFLYLQGLSGTMVRSLSLRDVASLFTVISSASRVFYIGVSVSSSCLTLGERWSSLLVFYSAWSSCGGIFLLALLLFSTVDFFLSLFGSSTDHVIHSYHSDLRAAT